MGNQGVCVCVALLRAVERDEADLGAGDEDARTAVVLGEFLGELECPAAAVAAVEAKDGAADGMAEPEERRQPAVAARGLQVRVCAENEVGDVGGRAPPFCDGHRRGGRGELRHGVGSDLYPRIEGWKLAIGELWMGLHDLVVHVRVPIFDAGFLTCNIYQPY
ncbi:Os07g0500951 [Oryza sativa Japonica Group]|uniref:Os07g0500951 protein n=1 Tax=Oryza sativa subsp. japonica TaxID=39947 RepID=A0A0P0X6D9_ORYSJ|nr:hypothetical protein EE612_039410 [Oryza sativa]BAT01640.1 Os07g0500951 [Oryza sativa Japonica Group]